MHQRDSCSTQDAAAASHRARRRMMLPAFVRAALDGTRAAQCGLMKGKCLQKNIIFRK
jgi:hypothetical protein